MQLLNRKVSISLSNITLCIQSDELRAKALELSETRKRVPNPFQVTFTGDSTLNADHCTNQGTQGTFQSYTTTACQEPVQFLDNPDTTHSELSHRGDHSQQPTGFQPRPAVVEVHAASLPSANAASFPSAYQSAAPEIPTVSVPSIGNIAVSQRNDSQFYLYRNALPKINLDTFDGDHTKWTDWNSRFQFMIGQAPLSTSQKIAYLQSLVKGRAKEVIQSFCCDGNYYEEAIVELKRRFGRPTVIVGTMIQQLIQHLPPVPNRHDTYIKFSSFIKMIIRVFEAHNFTADLYSTTNLKHATDKLPFLDAVKWQQFLVNQKN